MLIAVTGGPNHQCAMIFDLDGVLIHSMPLHVLAWERYLRGLGIQTADVERRMHGKRNAELVRDLISDQLSEEVIFGHGAAKERLFRQMVLETGIEKHRIPGVMEFLERHADVPKAVGSNAEPANIDFVLDRLGLRKFFAVTVNGLEVSRPKPFPDIYLEAAARLKAAPRDCIVFEDSPTGVDAARAAGMRVIGVETTPTEFQGVDLHIKDFLDPRLESWLQTQADV
jgi:HAD superfamily hydrolase (TIGR01509 family)